MELSQADAARRLNMTRSVVHRLWNPYQTEESVSRNVPHQGEEYPLVRCEGVFTIQVSMQDNQLCVYSSTDDREGPAYLGQENTFLRPDSDGLLYSLTMSPDSHWRAIQDDCTSGGNEAPDIINPTLLKDTVTEVVE
ncbi:paired domain-containing protein [Trichonephila clavipes]|nr:paired domain-containing protein [Trichonephila clavipes]